MDYTVGMYYGDDFTFSIQYNWPAVKLTVQPERLILSTIVRSIYLDASRVTGLSDYEFPLYSWPLGEFASGLRVEHSDPNYSQFLVIWDYNLTDIKNDLTENGFTLRY